MSGYIGNIPVPQATQTRDNFTATSGQTTFSTSGYTPNYLDVYLNGVHLDPSDYTATNGTDVVLGTGATAGDIVSVVAFTTFETVDQDFSGDFSVDGNTFVVDSTNNRVGISKSSPNYTLDVSGVISSDVASGDARIRWKTGTKGGWIGTPSWNSDAMYLYSPTTTASEQHVMSYNGSAVDGFAFLTGATPAERMRIDSSGRVTMPYQPFFYAYLSSPQTGYIPNNFSSTINYNATYNNVGNNFNTSNGTFTAPVNGLYYFEASCYSGGNNFNQMWLNVNGSRRYGTDQVHRTGDVSCGRCTVYLSAGDTVKAKSYYPSSTAITIDTSGYHTWFKGYLVG